MTLAQQHRAVKAIDEVANGRSILAASKAHQVERTYVRRRIEGIRTKQEESQRRQKVSDQMETSLAKWIVIQGNLGYAPPHARFRNFAQRLLINTGSSQVLGKKGVKRFLKRHPEVRTIKGVAIDYKRLNGATPETCEALYSQLSYPEIKRIIERNRVNTDEIGIMEGMGENSLMLGEAFRKTILLEDAHKREWISIVVCVTADDRALPPLIIFSGANVQQQWFDENVMNTMIGTSLHHQMDGPIPKLG